MSVSPFEPASLRVLIVDDEELARLRLRTLLGEAAAPGAQVVGEAGSVAQALAWLAERPRGCEIVMLDIQMPGADGTLLAAALRVRASQGEEVPAVIFVTAHEQHALRAFELEAVDYLTKPVRRDRLDAALARAARWLQAEQLRRAASTGPRDAPASAQAADAAPAEALAAEGSTAGAQPDAHERPQAASQREGLASADLVVSERGRIVRVPLSEVLYLKAELKYVTLRTAAHSYVLDDALSELEQRLGPRFLRVHRNALVARHAVSRLVRRPAGGVEEEGGESWAVCVEPVSEWLAVSRRQLPLVREAVRASGV